MTLDLHLARSEVLSKSDTDLEIETAQKWAARAIACFKLYDETSDMKWILRAESYHQEALEHAALARDDGDTLREIEAVITEEL